MVDKAPSRRFQSNRCRDHSRNGTLRSPRAFRTRFAVTVPTPPMRSRSFNFGRGFSGPVISSPASFAEIR